MKELKCPNCGAPINPSTYKCDYCGSKFKKDSDGEIIIESMPRGVIALNIKVTTPYAPHIDYKSPMFQESVRNMLSQRLAKEIMEYLEVYTDINPCTLEINSVARVRVLEPDCKL